MTTPLYFYLCIEKFPCSLCYKFSYILNLTLFRSTLNFLYKIEKVAQNFCRISSLTSILSLTIWKVLFQFIPFILAQTSNIALHTLKWSIPSQSNFYKFPYKLSLTLFKSSLNFLYKMEKVTHIFCLISSLTSVLSLTL